MHLPVFFCIQLTFIISNDCCTTVILPSVLTIILVPDLVLFKFRHLPNFWYFKNFFWLAILVGGGRWGNENMNCVGTWISRLKLVKNILRWSLVFWDICPKILGCLFCETPCIHIFIYKHPSYIYIYIYTYIHIYIYLSIYILIHIIFISSS